MGHSDTTRPDARANRPQLTGRGLQGGSTGLVRMLLGDTSKRSKEYHEHKLKCFTPEFCAAKMRTFATIAALAATVQVCQGLAFDLQASATRVRTSTASLPPIQALDHLQCVAEVVGQDILALGKYEVVGIPGGAPSGVDVTVSMLISDSLAVLNTAFAAD